MRTKYYAMLPALFIVLILFAVFGIGGSRVISTMSEGSALLGRATVVIDPGHGGVDGGATSYTGVLESNLNLEIAMRARDAMNLLGIKTKMIRTTDISVYTSGNTIAQKKVSDLKERVRITNSTPNACLLSIHQNHFNNPKYSGAQVFYANSQASMELADFFQKGISKILKSQRQSKSSRGIYLLDHAACPAILLECGFLSNPEEEAKLTDPKYQKNIAAMTACLFSEFLF